MRKIYEAPVVSVTKWVVEDVITTSGLTSETSVLTVDASNDKISSVSYDNID